jgi:hypothetical protein
MTRTQCSYCLKDRKYLTEMLSNGYYICNKCSKKIWNIHYKKLELMKNKK